MFCAIFSNSKWQPSWNPKLQKNNNNKTAKYKKHTGTKLDQFQPMALGILSFSCYAIFSNSPWRPSWIVDLYKYEIVPLRDQI